MIGRISMKHSRPSLQKNTYMLVCCIRKPVYFALSEKIYT